MIRRSAIADVIESVRRVRAWIDLGIEDFIGQYSRSFLGPLWALLQPSVWLIAIVVFFGPLMGADIGSYTLYVSVGITIYNYLFGAVVECGNAFVKHRGVIQNFPLPLFIFVLRETTVNLCKLMAQSFVVAAVLFYFHIPLPETAIWVVPGIFLVCFGFLSVSLITSIIAARSGDVMFAVVSVMRLVFFATPIIWIADEATGLRKFLVDINPFAQFIEVVRAPLMGAEVSTYSYAFTSAFTGCGLVVAFCLFALFRQRIPFWVQS